jgi:membrane protease YdiL (CAAX protease family)
LDREVALSADASISAVEKPPPGPVHSIFFNSAELRAGWRLVIFLLVLIPLFVAVEVFVFVLRRRGSIPDSVPILNDLITASLIFITTAVMAIIEKRDLADYGLPLRECLGRRFWLGAVFGLVTMTMVVAAMHVAGVIAFSKGTVQGQALATYATFAAITFVFGAMFEELTCRGYLLFTLTTGFGFWPAALVSSAIFGLLHAGNQGETAFGCFSTGVFGFLFCVLLRRTGNLWMPIGFHAAYNWAESFFYGTTDSGFLAHDRFLTVEVSGSRWLTGGSAGPEGSVLCVAIVLLLTIGVGFGMRGARFPDVTALKMNPRPAPEPDLPPVRS